MNRWFDKLPIIGNKIPGKITLSFLMLLFSLLLSLIFRTSDRITCFVAMLFSFTGDLMLNYKRNHDDQSKQDLVVGGISFIIAHIFYCITYYQKILSRNYQLMNLGTLAAIIIIAIITISISILSKSQRHSKLFAFGIFYLLLTGINYTTIFSYAYSTKSIESIVALGGLMFLISDVIIGLEKFSGLKSKLARELVWWFYPIGQIILIAIA